MAEEKEGVTTASSEQKTREMDGKKNYGRRKLPSDTIRESEEFFEVDKIVGMTKINGKERYKVRWVGYPASNDTWEPRENLLPCIEMVEDFERDRQRLKKRRAEERRIRKSQRHDPLAMMEGRLLPGTPLPDGKILSTATTTTTPTPTSSLTTASYGTVSSGANPLEANDSRNLSSIGNCGLLGQPPPTTLKDTFWKDLEEGKVDLFETDMYSKVKAQGRASRPKSFKNVFNKQSERLRGNNSQSTKKSSSKGNRKQNILAKYYSQRRIRTNHIRKSSDKNQYSFGPRTENSNLVSKNCDTSLTDCANNNDSIVTEDWDYMVDRKSPMMKPCDLNRMDCDTKSSISYSTTENCKEKFMYQRNITVQLSQGCRQPNSKDSPPSLQQVDCAVNEGTESDQSSKSQIALVSPA